MNNWFEVGEEVLLVSKFQPQHDGEYVIKELVNGNMYDVSEERDVRGVVVDLGFVADLGNQYWDIKSIRKKHKPSDESFKDMMQNIQSDVRIVEGVV